MDVVQLHYLVLCALDIEFASAKSALINDGAIVLDEEYYLGAILCSSLSLCTEHGDARIVIGRLPRPGTLAASIETCRMLVADTQTQCLISFGIAGSLNKQEITIGAVLVPNAIHYYEPVKEHEGRSKSRAIPLPVSNYDEVLVHLKQDLRSDVTVVLHRGLASGEKLIADIDSNVTSLLRGISEHVLAVDMEAAGVAAAIEWFRPDARRRRFIAIKGISDNADADKNRVPPEQQAKDRTTAADNAARVLLAFIRANYEPRELYQDRVGQQILSSASTRADLLARNVPEEILKVRIDPDRLARTVYNSQDLSPPVFYHFEQIRGSLHLVDLRYLLILRRLNELGFPAHALITEGEKLGSSAAARIAKDATALVGRQCTFFSDARREQLAVEEYTVHHSLVPQRYTELDRRLSKHFPSAPQCYEALRFWFSYMPWLASNSYRSQGFILFSWHRNVHIYHDMGLFLSLFPFVVTTRDVVIGGELAKFGSCGKDILFSPPEYPEIVSWIQSNREESEIAELVQHMEVGMRHLEIEISDVPFENIPIYRQIQSAKVGGSREAKALVERLGVILATLNKKVFQDVTH